jgi:membrane protein DedA with SNARE-associated domain
MHELIHWLDNYTDSIQVFIAAQVILAPLLLLFVEEAGLPIIIPGDAILAFTGYSISRSHHSSLWPAFTVALISVLCGSTLLYFISRKWGSIVINKIGKFIFLKPSHITRAEHLFAKYGALTIIFGRHLPGMRAPVTIFSGSSGVKYPLFIVSTFISTGLWILFYLSIGRRFGADIQQAIQKGAWATVAVVVAIIVILFTLHFIGERRANQREALASDNHNRHNKKQ